MSTEKDALRWLSRLEQKLLERRGRIELYDRYYDGNHDLEFASDKFKETFGGLFDEFADNWCQVVADAPEERLNVIGFRFGDEPGADADANLAWQRNQMDAQSQLVHIESIVNEESAVTVWQAPGDDEPTMDAEHPSEVIVATDPARRRQRLAALKMWTDEWTGADHATVYLPDALYKFKKVKRTSTTPLVVITADPGRGDEWVPRDVDAEPWPLPNPTGRVPVVPFPNKPRLLKPGASEIRNVIPLQNAVNKLITDMLVASELGAMPARWVAGWTLERDPDTNQPIPPKITDYLNRWVIGEDHQTGFGTFDQAQLDAFVQAIEMIVQHIAAQTRTPRHYLIQHGQAPSGDSIKGSETGLVRKVGRKQFFYGEDWEEVLRLHFAWKRDRRADAANAETIWADAESRTESEHIDAVSKRAKLGVPPQQLWEDAGYTPQQIARFPRMWAQFALLQPAGATGGAPQLPAPPGDDVDDVA